MQRTRVMVVDDNTTNLKYARSVLTDIYDVFTVPSAAKMFEHLKTDKPALILLDIEMPEMDGYEAARLLKENPDTKDIPVIFLTARNDTASEIKGLELGAVDYLSKPFPPPILKKRVELHITMEAQKVKLEEQTKELHRFNTDLQRMVDEKTEKVLKLQSAIIKTMANMVEQRDDTTGEHIERTVHLLEILLNEMERMGIYKAEAATWDKALLLQSSQLHDVGKISIKDSILNKPSRLTEEEFAEMKLHTTFGEQIIETIASFAEADVFLQYAKTLAGTHHEKWDGSGYPKGLKGYDIPLAGRLMAIVDVYDALVSERPYKKAFSHEDAVKIIVDGKGTHFDPLLIEVFLNAAYKLRKGYKEAEFYL